MDILHVFSILYTNDYSHTTPYTCTLSHKQHKYNHTKQIKRYMTAIVYLLVQFTGGPRERYLIKVSTVFENTRWQENRGSHSGLTGE